MAEGVASIYKNQTQPGNSFTSQEGSFYARVNYILLDDNAAKLKEMDVPAGTIGAIQCQVIYNGVVNESTPPIVALPHNSFLKRFPIKNEVVEIIAAITPKSNNPKDNNLRKYYYKDVLNVWDTAEHNSIPDQSNSTQPTGDFKETGKVSKLKHQTGDFTIEGRFGNTIRLGTSKVKGTAPWEGEENKPVTIIRNGQIDNNANLFEDVNKDGSSFYMLSGQSLPFIPANLNFDSYNQKVTAIDKSKVVTPILTGVPTPVTASLQQELTPTPIKDEPAVVYTTPTAVSSASTPDEEVEFLPDNENEFTQIFEDILIQPRSVVEGGLVQCNTVSKPTKSFSGISKNLNKIRGFVTDMLAAYPELKQDVNGSNKIKALLTIIANETGLTFNTLTEDLTYTYDQAVGAFKIVRKLTKKEFESKFGGPKVKNTTAFGNFIYGSAGNDRGNIVGTSDGSMFIGRGYFQITGRESYEKVSKVIYRSTSPKYKGLIPSPTFFSDKPDRINEKAYSFKVFMCAFFEGGICGSGYSVIKGTGASYAYNNVNDVVRLINKNLINLYSNDVYKSYLEKFSIIYNNKDLDILINGLLK